MREDFRRVARTVVLRSFAYGGICVIERHGPCRLWPFGCGGCSRGPGLLGSPGLAFPQTYLSLDIDSDVGTAQNAGCATCQRLPPSNPLTSPGALSDCDV